MQMVFFVLRFTHFFKGIFKKIHTGALMQDFPAIPVELQIL